MCTFYIVELLCHSEHHFAMLSLNQQNFTCGSPLSPEAWSFSFIRATLAAVALFLAPLRPLLFDTSFDSVMTSQVNRDKT